MRKYLSIVTVLLLACLALGAAFLSNEQVTSTKLNNLNNANITAGAGIDPEKSDDTSITTTEQDATLDPYVGDSQTLATDLEDEIQQLRFVIQELKQNATQAAGTEKWYHNAPTLMEFPTGAVQGDVVFLNESSVFRLGPSTKGLVLTTNGSSANPTWGSQGAHAWVQYDQTGTLTINASYNVSGVVDNGVGIATISWDVDFASNDYACIATGGRVSAGAINSTTPSGDVNITSVQIRTFDGATPTLIDADVVHVIAIGAT